VARPLRAHDLTSPFVNLAQAATYEAKSAENPANFRPYRWGTGGEPLPQTQKKAAKAHGIARQRWYVALNGFARIEASA
jgi:hypothetical protein